MTKIEEIKTILAEPVVDLWKLREVCLTEGGLLNDKIRRQAWPLLVGLNSKKTTHNDGIENHISKKDSDNDVKAHHPVLDNVEVIDPSTVQRFKNQIMAKSIDFNQIELDISRCTWHLLNGSQRSRRRQLLHKRRKKMASLLKRKQRRLGNLINLVLIQSYDITDGSCGFLRYFQGYHDVSCIFLSALGGNSLNHFPSLQEKDFLDSSLENETCLVTSPHVSAVDTAESMGLGLTTKVLLQVSKTHFRDPLQSNFENLVAALRLILMPLIGCFDSQVHSVLAEVEMEPFFTLSWVITWFSHDVRDTSLVKRLFDVFIASHPLMPIYLSVAMVLHPVNRMEVLSGELDFATIHNILSQLPRNSCSVGWKFICEGEYESGDEASDDEKVSIDGGSIISSEDHLEHDDESTAPSLTAASMVSTFDSNRVPFQEVIDLAITFMQQVPPRNLINLARRYYTNANVSPLLKNSSSIGLLQPSPAYALEATIKNPDMRRRLHGQRSITPLKRSRQDYLISYPQALVVAGIGPDTAIEIKKKRRRRRFIILSAILAATVAIACSGGGNTAEFTVPSLKSITPDELEVIENVSSQEEEENENENENENEIITEKIKPGIRFAITDIENTRLSENTTFDPPISTARKSCDPPISNKLDEKEKRIDKSIVPHQTKSETKQGHGDDSDIEYCTNEICGITADVTKQIHEGATNEKATSSDTLGASVEKSTTKNQHNRPLCKLISNIAKTAREELGQDAESIAL